MHVEIDEGVPPSSKENKDLMVHKSLVSVPTRFERMNREIVPTEANITAKAEVNRVLHSPIAFGVQGEDKPSKSETQAGSKVPNLPIGVYSIAGVGSIAIDPTIDI